MVQSQQPSRMTVAALARTAGVGVETVRFYQRRGLMPTPPRPGGSGASGGFRTYGPDDVRRLHFIRSAQTAGFSLSEVAELLELDAGDDHARVRALAGRRLDALDRQIAALKSARAALSALVASCGGPDAGPCPILGAFET